MEEVVEPQPEPTTVPENPYIVTLEELVGSTEAVQKKESDDRTLTQQISSPNSASLRAKLLEWASLGFPAAYEIISITITPPQVCSDGQQRNKFQYVNYLLGMELGDQLRIVEAKLPGMSLSYSTPDSRVKIHVSKVEST